MYKNWFNSFSGYTYHIFWGSELDPSKDISAFGRESFSLRMVINNCLQSFWYWFSLMTSSKAVVCRLTNSIWILPKQIYNFFIVKSKIEWNVWMIVFIVSKFTEIVMESNHKKPICLSNASRKIHSVVLACSIYAREKLCPKWRFHFIFVLFVVIVRTSFAMFFFSSPNKPKIMRSGVNVWMESNDADQPNIAKLPIVSTTFTRGKYIAHILFFCQLSFELNSSLCIPIG